MKEYSLFIIQEIFTVEDNGQSSVEWLMSHAWSIVVVLTVASVLVYVGVFEGSARPRFEGLNAAGVQPVGDQVKLYSDGVMVLTVMNKRPYSHNLEWVEVSPIIDKNDVIRTWLDDTIKQGDIKTYTVNATNLVPHISEGGILPIPEATAESTVDFWLCMKETHSAGGTTNTKTICGEGINIIVLREPHTSDPCDNLPGESYCDDASVIDGIRCLPCQSCAGNVCMDDCDLMTDDDCEDDPFTGETCVCGQEGECILCK